MKRTVIIVLSILLPALIAFIAYSGYNVVYQPNIDSDKLPYDLFVEEGTTIEQVYAQLLEDELLIERMVFYFLLVTKDWIR